MAGGDKKVRRHFFAKKMADEDVGLPGYFMYQARANA